jgi:hypothetical protein
MLCLLLLASKINSVAPSLLIRVVILRRATRFNRQLIAVGNCLLCKFSHSARCVSATDSGYRNIDICDFNYISLKSVIKPPIICVLQCSSIYTNCVYYYYYYYYYYCSLIFCFLFFKQIPSFLYCVIIGAVCRNINIFVNKLM